MMGHEVSPADDGQRGASGEERSESEQPPRAAELLTLYVHEELGGLRVLTGGGITADGICADIFATLCPGGAWHGVPYADLLPGRYALLDDRFVRADGCTVLPGE